MAAFESINPDALTIPKNLDEFIADAPKLQEAGVIPFAIGGEAWQIGGAMGVVMLSQLGKGESSGHFQHVKEVRTDCDRDAVLVKVVQEGGACHEGYRSCFFRKLETGGAGRGRTAEGG